LSNLVIFGLIFISCKKEPVISSLPNTGQNPLPPAPQPSPPVNPVYTTPSAFAGSDIYIVFPVDSCSLVGSAQYPDFIEIILWNKISGPGSFVIENPGSYKSKVRNLEKGAYAFELSITDKTGLTSRDTVSVNVLTEGSGENVKVFKDLQWGCPMGCHMRIENFYSYIPMGTAFKAYVKRDNSTQWVEVVNINASFSKYMWTIYNNGLEILEDQTEFPQDTPDVMITF